MKLLPEAVTDFFEAAPEVLSVMTDRFYNDVDVATDALTKVANQVHDADAPERAKTVGRLATEDSAADAPAKPQKPEVAPVAAQPNTVGLEQSRQLVENSYTQTPVEQTTPAVREQPTATPAETYVDDARMAEIAAQIDAAYAEQGITSQVFKDQNILGVNRDSASL